MKKQTNKKKQRVKEQAPEMPPSTVARAIESAGDNLQRKSAAWRNNPTEANAADYLDAWKAMILAREMVQQYDVAAARRVLGAFSGEWVMLAK